MKALLKITFTLALLAAAGWGLWRASQPEPVTVILAPVERGTVEATAANTRAGTVKACRRSHLSPATGGQVANLPVKEGDRVRTGQLLMVIWNEDLNANLLLAESEVATARAGVKEACLRADVAKREARRMERLAKQKLVSEEQRDRASTDAKARQAACDGMRATLQVRKAQVGAAQAALERTILKAPFAGVIAEVNAELGEFVTPSPPGIPTPPAVDLIDDQCLYITAPIDEVDAPAIRLGMPACVSLDAFPEPICNARVRRIAPYVLDVEKQARTVEIEVEFGNLKDGAGLIPGYSADIEVVLEHRERVLRIPTEAILEGDRVLVYAAENATLEERHFKPGLANWRFTEVLEGLRQGEQIVTSVGREGVEAGALVTPETATATP